MINMELRKYIECSHEEKLHLVDVINKIIHLAVLARKEGVLALEEQSQNMQDSMLRLLLELICDGVDPQSVTEIADNTIFASFETGAKLLEKIIIKEGLLSIQSGENPMIIETKLLALLGNDFARGKIIDIEEEYKKLMQEIDSLTPINGLPEFEELLNTSNHDMQIILRQGIFNHDLSAALKGASKELRHHFFNNLVKRLCVYILQDIKDMPKENIPIAQQKILDRYNSLKKAGEIS